MARQHPRSSEIAFSQLPSALDDGELDSAVADAVQLVALVDSQLHLIDPDMGPSEVRVIRERQVSVKRPGSKS